MTTPNEIKPAAPAEGLDGGRCAVDAGLCGEKLMQLWEAYERDGPGCAMYLYKADAEACEAFENGIDRVVLSTVRVSETQLTELYLRQPIFA